MTPAFNRLSLTLAGVFFAFTAWAEAPTDYGYRILAERTHAEQLFTQGLLLRGDTFYESSGGYGHSLLVSYPHEGQAGEFTLNKSLPKQYFAEGLSELADKLYLLTWRKNTALVFARDDFELLASHRYSGEGWGLTNNGEQLIRSDGSHRLFFHDPEDFSLLKTLEVRDGDRPVKRLNELEFIDGRIWANIWQDHRLVEIDPDSGQVTGYLDLSALVGQAAPGHTDGVLNGIAWDPERNAMWVTGKNWPTLFLIQLQRSASSS